MLCTLALLFGVYTCTLHAHVVIEGRTGTAVAHAKRRVEMVAWTNRFKEEPTHFLSIPLTAPHVMERFRLFKEQVLTSCGKVHVNTYTYVYTVKYTGILHKKKVERMRSIQ